jgi:hypothetical protein
LPWTIELSDSAERTLRKLDRQSSRRIGNFIDSRLVGIDDPRASASLYMRRSTAIGGIGLVTTD